jgi:quercetin dioxygenase-like cupin family protein
MRKNQAIQIVVLATTLSCTAGCSEKQAQQKTGPESSQPIVFHLETANWSEPYDGPLGYPKGAQRATVSTDAASGGETYYARFPAGTRFQLHWHEHAEYAVVLRGKVIHTLGTASQTLEAGDYFIIPAKTNHGYAVDPSGDAFLLIRRDGPTDFNFVEQ